MLKTLIRKPKRSTTRLLGHLKKHISAILHMAVISWILAFISFLLCAVAPTYTLLRLCNILLLVFFLSGVCLSAVFNYLYFFYHPDKHDGGNEGG